ncbi:calcineurin inhibitor [Candidozyma auris]
MPRQPTNTLIVSRLSGEAKENPAVLAGFLAEQGIQVELVSLPKLERYIIICGTLIDFSLKDNHSAILGEENWALKAADTQYLELPSESGSRRFLISPPLSPQGEWNDYDKVEEGPNQTAVYSPEELSHLLWDRFGGFDSTHVKKYKEESEDEEEEIENDGEVYDISQQPQVLFENIDNGVPAIVVDSVRHQKSRRTPPLPKTAMPPMD